MSNRAVNRSGGICFGTTGAAAEPVGLCQVVPPTGTADLNDVAGEITLLTGERRKLGLLRNAAPVGRKPGAEDVGDMHKGFFFADRTRFRGGFTEVLRGPNQLRVGVAHIDSRKTPALVLSYQMATNQTKVNRSRPTLLDAANGVSSKRHSGEATAMSELPFALRARRPAARQEKCCFTRFRNPCRSRVVAWSLP